MDSNLVIHDANIWSPEQLCLGDLTVTKLASGLDFLLAIRGSIRVVNRAYEKLVFARVTVDNWASFQDHIAHYSKSSEDGATDVFVFEFIRRHVRDCDIELAMSCLQGGVQSWDNNFGRNYRFHLQPDPFDSKIHQQQTGGAVEEIIKESAATMSETLPSEINKKNPETSYSRATETKKSESVTEHSSSFVSPTQQDVTIKENKVSSAHPPSALASKEVAHAKSEYSQFKAHPLISTKTDLYLDDIIAKSNQTKATHVEAIESERILHEDHIQEDIASPSFCMNTQETPKSTLVDEQIISHTSNNASISYSHHVSVLKQLSLQENNAELDATGISDSKEDIAGDVTVEIEDIILDSSPSEAVTEPAGEIPISEVPILALRVEKSKDGNYFPELPAQIQSSSEKAVNEKEEVQQDGIVEDTADKSKPHLVKIQSSSEKAVNEKDAAKQGTIEDAVEDTANKSKPHLDTLLVVEESRTSDEFVDDIILDDKTLHISEGSLSSTDDDSDRKVKSNEDTREAEKTSSQNNVREGKGPSEGKTSDEGTVITDVQDVKQGDKISECVTETTKIEDVNDATEYDSLVGKSANKKKVEEPEDISAVEESKSDRKSSSESSTSKSDAELSESKTEKSTKEKSDVRTTSEPGTTEEKDGNEPESIDQKSPDEGKPKKRKGSCGKCFSWLIKPCGGKTRENGSKKEDKK